MAPPFLPSSPPTGSSPTPFDLVAKHGHQDLVQAVAFNDYGDRCATGSVDGRVRVFNRHQDGTWRLCDSWVAHPGDEVLELQWLPPTVFPNLLASLGMAGRFKLWAEDPAAPPGRRFSGGSSGGAGGRSGVVGSGVGGLGLPPSSANPSMVSLAGLVTSGGPTMRTGSYGEFFTGPSPGGGIAGGPASGGGGGTNTTTNAKPAFETQNAKSPYRSFSLRHSDEGARHTYLALASADGRVTVYENESGAGDLGDWAQLDEFICLASPPQRGEETAFRVRFDPNPDVCYTALRAGVPADALGLVVAAMDSVRVYRTRDTVSSSLGITTATREFYLAAEVPTGMHGGLVRDVAWAPGNIRGYDVIATACQDGFVRVFGLATPVDQRGDATSAGGHGRSGAGSRGWPTGELLKKNATTSRRGVAGAWKAESGIRAGLDNQSRGGATSENAGPGNENAGSASGGGPGRGGNGAGGVEQNSEYNSRRITGLPGQILHTLNEIARLDSHRTPVWRVGFDDDGQILGSVGDEGKLMCYRQMPDGAWAKSAELSVLKMRMAVP